MDRARLRAGLGVASRYLGATISFYLMMTLDRYLLEALGSTAEVGVYTLFIGLAGAVTMIVQSGVVVSLFPDVVSAAGEEDWVGHRQAVGRMGRVVLLTTVAATVVAGIAIFPVLAIVDRPA
jgi:O-antigen/teichoic acid export membrane protein